MRGLTCLDSLHQIFKGKVLESYTHARSQLLCMQMDSYYKCCKWISRYCFKISLPDLNELDFPSAPHVPLQQDSQKSSAMVSQWGGIYELWKKPALI